MGFGCARILFFDSGLALLLASFPGAMAGADSAAGIPPSQLVREVVRNEVHFAEAHHSRWMYRQHHTDARTDEVKECVDSREITICRVLARRGRPLSPEESQREIQHLEALAKNPQKLKEQQKSRQQDGDRALKMLKMLPDAFNYQYDGKQGKYLRLRFDPNPNFKPPDRAGRMFHAMVGYLIIDPESKRLVAIKGRLVKDVDFGLGLLGHLYRGGVFEVKREEVAEGVWETTLLDVNIHGRAMFFKTINAQQQEVTDDFKQVPPNLSVAQAASLLGAPALQVRSQNAAEASILPAPFGRSLFYPMFQL